MKLLLLEFDFLFLNSMTSMILWTCKISKSIPNLNLYLIFKTSHSLFAITLFKYKTTLVTEKAKAIFWHISFFFPSKNPCILLLI